MLIEKCSVTSARSPSDFAWMGLARFQNVPYVKGEIIRLHKLDPKHHKNAERIAVQIRYCLMQAKEYYEAATRVSLATKPALLYYCIMSLALAETLFKQNGDNRLEKLRENHRHHGLTLSTTAPFHVDARLVDICTELKVKQHGPVGRRVGTFEVWRRGSRPYPVGGLSRTTNQVPATSLTERINGETVSYKALVTGEDKACSELPEAGGSLLECIMSIPSLVQPLMALGIPSATVRAKLSNMVDVINNVTMYEFIIHPHDEFAINAFNALVLYERDAINHMDVAELPHGYILKTMAPSDLGILRSFPAAVSLDSKNTYFSCGSDTPNEFGLYYIALHICGNFARYFPDKWLKHVETSSDFSLVINALLESACERVPLLTYSELRREFFVPEALA